MAARHGDRRNRLGHSGGLFRGNTGWQSDHCVFSHDGAGINRKRQHANDERYNSCVALSQRDPGLAPVCVPSRTGNSGASRRFLRLRCLRHRLGVARRSARGSRHRRKHCALVGDGMRVWFGCALASASVEARPQNCGGPCHARLGRFHSAGDLLHKRVARSEMSKVSVVIPALNEEEPIAGVVRECLATGVPAEVIVVDNGSTDRTAERAREAAARVITAPRGYGLACAAGARAVSVPQSRDDIMVFLDGDGSDIPAFIPQLVEPITRGTHDFVIGSRTRGQREGGSMNFQQILSGRIAGWITQLLYGVRYTDMCPFRAIRRDALANLDMREETYGWNLEMQMKAARAGLRILEIPVNHRLRTGGESKVSGTLRGTFVAGT